MAVIQSILIVTSTPGFGELIQQSLEETGEYQALLVDSSKEALALAQYKPFSLAILDSDLADADLPALALSLKRIIEHLCLVVIPPDNDPQHPLLTQIPFDGFLTKPFYLPDLLDTVAEVLCKKLDHTPTSSKASSPHSSVHASNVPDLGLEWIKDVNRAAQHLTRLSLESSAQAALIVRQGELWAYAGQLSQPAAQELAGAVLRFWMDRRLPAGTKSIRSVDMVRVVRLNTTRSDYMLYVTALGREMVLALAFDAETPFSTIRAQANSLARSLASPIEGRSQIKSSPVTAQHDTRLPHKPFSRLPSTSKIKLFDDDLDDLEGDIPPIDLLPLIDDVPLPDPNSHRTAGQPRSLFSPDALPNPTVRAEQSDVVQQISQPEIVKEELQPITPALHGLYYVCLLIPRLPQHHLTGDLASALSKMVSQMCLAYGWRLEQIAIRPEYLQWITSVPPTTSPGYLMRVLRQQTSERIFDAFSTLRKDNPSGDFWAPGYLIMSGSQLPPAQIVKEFIQQTRQQQGACLPSRPKA